MAKRTGKRPEGASKRAASVAGWLGALPGAVAQPGPAAGVSLYKVKGKLFAVLELRNESVILKCDPDLVEVLREAYGVSHRGHFDRRFWISVALGGAMPSSELKRLLESSYELVRGNLTRAQRAELEAG